MNSYLGNTEILQSLITAGASLDFKDEKGETALILMA
jgi:ankyrin repeat protein